MKHFIFIALIFYLALPCVAQEGCGRWVEVNWMGWDENGKTVASLCTFGDSLGDVKCPDSVWMPEQCHKDTSSGRLESGDWYLEYKQAQLSYGTKDGWRSDTITVRIRLDTLWQVAESVWIEKAWR